MKNLDTTAECLDYVRTIKLLSITMVNHLTETSIRQTMKLCPLMEISSAADPITHGQDPITHGQDYKL